ncbi:MAG: WG repeat-containing protein [Bacteroidota bacterium]
MKPYFKVFLLLCILTFAFNISFAQKKNGNKNASKASGNDKWGVTEKYDAAGPFCDGLARVKTGIKWGYIDTTGSVIIPLKYNEVENFKNGLARVRLGQKWGLFDNTGKELRKPTFTFIGDFIDGKAKVLLEGEEYFINKEGMRVDKNGKHVDRDGEIVE